MRRLMQHRGSRLHDREQGAVSVLVALLMVILLGFAAIAVDVGMMYSERAQLRNGADAAAIGIAQTCAKNKNDVKCSGSLDNSSLAKQLADANALDGQTNASNVILNKDAGKVAVTTGSLEPGNSPNRLGLFFARALGFKDIEISVTSHAAWGQPVAGPAIFPLALAECKINFNSSFDAPVQTLEMGNDAGTAGCGWVPGGFGWLDTEPTTCSAKISAPVNGDPGIWHHSKTGVSVPTTCGASDFLRLRNQTILFPLYDRQRGTGESAEFHITGFAAFHVTGYQITSYQWSLDGSPIRNSAGAVCDKCLKGYFKRFVALDSAYTLDPTDVSGGTNVVKLTLGESP